VGAHKEIKFEGSLNESANEKKKKHSAAKKLLPGKA